LVNNILLINIPTSSSNQTNPKPHIKRLLNNSITFLGG